MSLLDRNDIKDELIAPVVSDEILEEVDAYFQDVLYKFDLTLDDIPTPLPFGVKRLLVAWVCREVCINKGKTFSGGLGVDRKNGDLYVQKLKLWEDELKRLEGGLTVESLTGKKDNKGVSYGTVTIYRS